MEVNVYAIKEKINKHGKCPLRVHVGSYVKANLKINVTFKNWDSKKQRVKSAESFYFEINESIEKKVNKIKKYIIENPTFSSIDIANLIEDKEEQPASVEMGLFQFWDDYIERNKGVKSDNFLRQYKQIKEHLITFDPLISFSSFSKIYFDKYAKYLLKKGISTNTAALHIKRIRLILKDAIQHGYQVNNTILSYKVTEVKTKSAMITWEQVEAIEKARNLTEEEEKVRDGFLFRCNTGIRDSDYKNLTAQSFIEKNKTWCIRFNSQKTKKDQYLALNSKALAIARKYEFNLPQSSQQSNNRLIKIVASKAKLRDEVEKVTHSGSKRTVTLKKTYETISTHTARRVFARRWYDLGGDIRMICHFLGHSNESQTRVYIGIDDEEINTEMIRVFDQALV